MTFKRWAVYRELGALEHKIYSRDLELNLSPPPARDGNMQIPLSRPSVVEIQAPNFIHKQYISIPLLCDVFLIPPCACVAPLSRPSVVELQAPNFIFKQYISISLLGDVFLIPPCACAAPLITHFNEIRT